MKRVVVIAKGEVQRVGYRDEVERIARKLGLTGYVENLKPYDVKIVAEGDEDKLRQFIGLLKIQKYPIFVEELDVSWHDATGEFNYFEIKRGDWREELFERLDAAGRLLHRSVELGERNVELGEKSVRLGEENLKLIEKSVKLGEKSISVGEEILRAIREESERTREVVKEESEKTRNEIKLLRSDLREYIEVSLKDIRNRIMEIEAALKRAGIM